MQGTQRIFYFQRFPAEKRCQKTSQKKSGRLLLKKSSHRTHPPRENTLDFVSQAPALYLYYRSLPYPNFAFFFGIWQIICFWLCLRSGLAVYLDSKAFAEGYLFYQKQCNKLPILRIVGTPKIENPCSQSHVHRARGVSQGINRTISQLTLRAL